MLIILMLMMLMLRAFWPERRGLSLKSLSFPAAADSPTRAANSTMSRIWQNDRLSVKFPLGHLPNQGGQQHCESHLNYEEKYKTTDYHLNWLAKSTQPGQPTALCVSSDWWRETQNDRLSFQFLLGHQPNQGSQQHYELHLTDEEKYKMTDYDKLTDYQLSFFWETSPTREANSTMSLIWLMKSNRKWQIWDLSFYWDTSPTRAAKCTMSCIWL